MGRETSVKSVIALIFVGTVLSSAGAPAYSVTYKRSWESCVALAEERGFIGSWTRGRRDKNRFIRNCRIGTQI
jgi:hypothetical protein